ncbi:MAG: hypothetical protein Q9226_003975, partial [Calogaya cf. arnoldii]
ALIKSAECLHTKQNPELGHIYEHTRGIVFMGTPHRGSDKTGYADLISKIASAALRQPNRKLVEVLKQDSDVLEAQRGSFSAISKDMPIACIYETVPVKGIGIQVPEYSACMDGFYVEREQIEANHMEMCKFNDPDDIGYRRTVGFILDFKHLVPSVFPIKWNKEYAIRSADNAMSWMNHTRESPSWDWRELIEAFQLLTDPSWQRMQNARMRICVFVDGMDEYRTLDDSTLSPNEVINCKKDGYREITRFFEALACSPDVKLCLSSRPLTEFKDAFNTKDRLVSLWLTANAIYYANRIEDRLRSRCAGLLEVVRVTVDLRYEYTTGNISYKEVRQARVQFMHQTAKDFAEQPELRNFLLPESDSVFNPYTPLLVSCILELKLTDPLHQRALGPGRTQGGTTRNWALIRDAMLYAFREETRELILNPPNAHLFRMNHSPKGKKLHAHWACLAPDNGGLSQHIRDERKRNTHPGDPYTHRPDFLSFATQYGLSRYVEIKMAGCHNVSLADRPGKPLLQYCFEQEGVPLEHRLRPRMFQVLCDRGAHPLDEYRGSTAWDELMSHPAAFDGFHSQMSQNWREVAEIFVQATERTGKMSHLLALLSSLKVPTLKRDDGSMSCLSLPRDKLPKNLAFLLYRLRIEGNSSDTLQPSPHASNLLQKYDHSFNSQLLLPHGNDAGMHPPHYHISLPTTLHQPYPTHLQPYPGPRPTPTYSAYYPSIKGSTERPEPIDAYMRATQQMQGYTEPDPRTLYAPYLSPQIQSTGRNHLEYPTRHHANPASGYPYALGPSFTNPPMAQGYDMNAGLTHPDPWTRFSAAATPAPLSIM